MNTELLQIAEKNVRDILTLAIKHDQDKPTIVIYDQQCALATTLTEAYKSCLPQATFIDFYAVTPESINALFQTLSPGDLVILIQSTSFRLNAFRLRVELFEKSLKVIEHPHLSRMTEEEGNYYIESLAYDPAYLHTTGHALKQKIDSANKGIVVSGNDKLIFDSPFEAAKLNIGDYTNMKNIGGQFPIGEVFTESKNLESVNGRVQLFAFGDTTFSVYKVEQPIILEVTKGQISNVFDSVPEFDLVLDNIRKDENVVWMRELGFGLNRAFTKNRLMSDIGTYERMCGVHLSLGGKHTVYKKPGFTRNNTWHHVDVFVNTEAVYLDDERIFEGEKWVV